MSGTGKTLVKILVIWAVVAAAVIAADLAQLQYAANWFRPKLEKLQAVPKAPRPLASANSLFGFSPNGPAYDTSPKTYPWQVAQPNPGVLDTAAPQVVLIPTEFAGNSPSWSIPRGDKALGIRASAQTVLLAAYQWTGQNRSRTIFSAAMPPGQFDFIANLSTGSLEALQAEIKKKWGLVGAREMIPTNVLVLKLHHADAPGLKPGEPATGPMANDPGSMRFRNVPMASLTRYLESMLGQPVIDQTGLTERYDIEFARATAPRGASAADRVEETAKIIQEQLGLALIPSNAPVEMLVIKKAN